MITNVLVTAGNEDVAAFMRALGYDFKSDPGSELHNEGLLFRRALRATHPDKQARALPRASLLWFLLTALLTALTACMTLYAVTVRFHDSNESEQ